jgi:DNA-binding transcriptional ArsR family regulator
MDLTPILPAETATDACPLDAMAASLSALAHPARLRILRHLSGKGACCCGEVVEQLDLAQSTVSQHLRVLVDAGLVRYTPESRRSRYTVDEAGVTGLSHALAAYLGAVAAPGCCD